MTRTLDYTADNSKKDDEGLSSSALDVSQNSDKPEFGREGEVGSCSTKIDSKEIPPLKQCCAEKSELVTCPCVSQVENYLKRSVGSGAMILPYHTAVEEGQRNNNLKVGNTLLCTLAICFQARCGIYLSKRIFSEFDAYIYFVCVADKPSSYFM
jgi:hypothetical protein